MGLCVSRPATSGSSVAASPEQHPNPASEQVTPHTPSVPETSVPPSLQGLPTRCVPRARRGRSGKPTLQPHEVQQAAYQLGMRLSGRPIEDASDRQRLADATETVHETRLALHRGRGNVDSDLRLSNGRSATYSSLSYSFLSYWPGKHDIDLLAGSALAAGAGNCDHNAAVNARRHAVRMEDGGQMMNVRDYARAHLYALYQPPSSAEAEESPVVLDSWGDGPAVLLRDSHWAETYGTSTNVIERFDKRDAIDALARTNAFRAEIEDPQTDLHANARDLETAFRTPPAPGDIFSAMPVIAPELAQSTRQRLQEYSPRTRQALAADAARQAYGLDNAQPISPRTTAAILQDAERLDALGRPPLSWAPTAHTRLKRFVTSARTNARQAFWYRSGWRPPVTVAR
ncbi:avirulence protein [Xanthomonas citri pv. citri]|uniref:XopE/AvrPphe family type III secretion system effector n=1 Tax=Xanthomonas citri TaxID=346 RepID=UPI00064CB4E4|nr:XopE/AvrPphe family type III secretion system effector [Xanthomonas citri]AKM23558.1 avirulence protein [Xanthomonas citri pv. citri]